MFFANPVPVLKIAAAGPGGVQFTGTTNWIYTLERSTDFQTWQTVSLHVVGVSGTINIDDTNPPPVTAFYRVRADLP